MSASQNLIPINFGSFTPNKTRREYLWIKEGKKCHWCSRPTRMVNDTSWDKATTEHVIPKYKGGTNDESNLVSACNRCNNRRSYEDQCGLPDGSLLGKYKESQSNAERKAQRRAFLNRVALTADEKKALMQKLDAKTPN